MVFTCGIYSVCRWKKRIFTFTLVNNLSTANLKATFTTFHQHPLICSKRVSDCFRKFLICLHHCLHSSLPYPHWLDPCTSGSCCELSYGCNHNHLNGKLSKGGNLSQMGHGLLDNPRNKWILTVTNEKELLLKRKKHVWKVENKFKKLQTDQ